MAACDRYNRLTQPRRRDEVHALGIYHRSVIIWVFGREGLLLQKRSDTKDICPAKWDVSVAGHVSPWEGYRRAARRETAEELGLKDVVLKRLLKPHLHRHQHLGGRIKDNEFVTTFSCTSSQPIRLDLSEIAQARFFPEVMIKDWVIGEPEAFTPWFLVEWRFLRKLIGPA